VWLIAYTRYSLHATHKRLPGVANGKIPRHPCVYVSISLGRCKWSRHVAMTYAWSLVETYAWSLDSVALSLDSVALLCTPLPLLPRAHAHRHWVLFEMTHWEMSCVASTSVGHCVSVCNIRICNVSVCNVSVCNVGVCICKKGVFVCKIGACVCRHSVCRM